VSSWDVSFRILVNYFGDRITDVGALGLPDIVEQGREAIDFVAIKRFGERAQLRFTGENLTDADRTFTQGGQLQRLFKIGPTFGVNFSYSVY
jgi:hypothetical protein